MSKLQLTILAGALGVVAALIFAAPMTRGVASTDTYRQLNLFGDVFERVKNDYVREVPDNELIENALNGMLASLDPHSSYMNPKEFSDMQVQTRGEFGGLGLEVTMQDGLVKVISPMDGTPAARAGIKTGDLISTIDGQTIQGMTLSDAVDKMRGPPNTQVRITIIRKGDKKPLELTLTREVVQVDSVRFRADNDIAYIRMTVFSEKAQEGLERAVDQAKKQIGSRLRGVVLDLRNNPGGLLDQAISVSSAFINHGEIVSTRGRKASDIQRYNATGKELLPGVPMIVLINEGSASASEIVAGALQDYKRARLVGMRSFGKGSVQTVIPLSGGTDGALRLTTAKYYTPSGRSIQATGIDPDIEVQQTAETPPPPDPRDIRSEASLRNHLEDEGAQAKPRAGPVVKPKPGEKFDDFQLTYAERLLRGQEVVSMSTTATPAPSRQK